MSTQKLVQKYDISQTHVCLLDSQGRENPPPEIRKDANYKRPVGMKPKVQSRHHFFLYCVSTETVLHDKSYFYVKK